MYVRWRVLICLGTLFWSLSCLADYFWISRLETAALVGKQIAVPEVKDGFDEPALADVLEQNHETIAYVQIFFWNFLAFLSTLSVCFMLKSLAKLWCSSSREIVAGGYEDGAIPLRRLNSSKIPIPISGKSSSTDIHVDGVHVFIETADDNNKSCPNLGSSDSSDVEKNASEEKLKRILSIRNMENHCAKLREEMINLQASSMKEHSSISKKIDVLAKEKRDCNQQINTMKKENKSLKQQLERMLDDRSLLVKRLECATKEIRVNTNSKKVAMVKLDEAQATAKALTSNLEQISADKLILEDKLMLLNAEYTRLKEELELYKNDNQARIKNLVVRTNEIAVEKEHVIDKDETADSCQGTTSVGLPSQTYKCQFDISQSEQDMRKVQQKLINLERSLESFKFRQNVSIPTKDVHEPDENEANNTEEKSLPLYQDDSLTSIDEEPSTNSICTELSCPLEHMNCHSAECFLKNVDRKLYLDENTDFSSGDESASSSRMFKKPERLQNNFSPRRRLVKYIRSSISDDRLSVISERATTTGEDSEEGSEPKRRIVSESPEFQKFLRKRIEPAPVDSKFKQKLENALINYCDV